ncbi:hypothetical protein PF008_g13533 [Phytophthora fragariae]|uniref:Uncharacterized protein n=1 Tax=Phytophthora fragariae TaxID=53985 RepID=A0A6G0RL37_9STRA|nr:hypothetical protein PF008_g13533 [Phytophthora fragariae]
MVLRAHAERVGADRAKAAEALRREVREYLEAHRQEERPADREAQEERRTKTARRNASPCRTCF